MNAVEVLRPPWIASARTSRWFALVVLIALAVAEAFVLGMMQGKPRAAAAGFTWCAALALWWLLVVPNALWLARDATALGLPRIRRLANTSVLAHAVLTGAIPAIVFALVMGHPLVWCVGFALTITCCLLFMLLPGSVLLVLWLGFIVIANLHVIHFKAATPDRLALYGAVLALALAGMTVWRWSRVIAMPSAAGTGLGKPFMWNLHLQAARGFGGLFGRQSDAAMARGARAWLTPQPDLRRVGPAHPVRTIRVALSRNTMPKSLASQLRLTAFALIFAAVGAGQIVLQGAHHNLHQMLTSLLLSNAGGAGLASSFAAIAPILAVGIFGWRLLSRWTAANNELPLLHLLPRLGSATVVRRSTAIACLVNVAYVVVIEWALLYAGGLLAHSSIASVIFATLCSATTFALTAAITLRALGGKPLNGLLVVALTILTAAVCTMAMSITLAASHADVARAASLAVALLIMLVVLIAIGYDGWRALQRRPHPFLANA